MRFGPACKTLPVNRQDIFDERVEFVFPGEIRRKLMVGNEMRKPVDQRPGADHGGAARLYRHNRFDRLAQNLETALGHGF